MFPRPETDHRIVMSGL
jgi:hypothetical protein